MQKEMNKQELSQAARDQLRKDIERWEAYEARLRVVRSMYVLHNRERRQAKKQNE